ncbi:hypothetical protein [Mesorhizobium temperatum]|jgi:hypothetical protein|uniref:Uncharacterized protein n=1 Tax=Mesorhizobium temperatum TaxID=241416 RepID=A0A271LAS2_9HYPH|nr:hypothetical protein [Mesorhizobium temperatum]PAQ05221.1 hypothetical protein CIT26_30950 [Mesorhizobium temperatum]
MWNKLPAAWFLPPKETHTMLRFLIRLGALYAAFAIGREFGRRETEVMLLPPADDDRRPSEGNEAEFGEPT